MGQRTREAVKVRGFFQIQIVNPDGSIAGDSGRRKNTVVNDGYQDYLCRLIAAQANSKQISHVALGTGTAVNATHQTLNGEVGSRTTMSVSISNTSKTVRFTATFPAGWHNSAAAHNISNIGLFNTSSGGTIFAGNTYASSACASNQAVNCTYDIVFT